MFSKERNEYSVLKKSRTSHSKKRILIYHISGLSFGGTEKNLQMVANGLVKEYEVYYMYAGTESRKGYLHNDIKLIPFSYTSVEKNSPYYISGMNPHIKQVIEDYEIDMLIVSDVGHALYPFITITDIPIVMINNFGAPTLQKNIAHVNYVSETVRDHAFFWIGNQTHSVLYTPTTRPMKKEDVEDLRKELNIPDDHFVFGRIGRESDDIFDPIGIRAFQKVIEEYPSTHYIIMNAPPKLLKIIDEDKIPNVHLFSSKGDEAWVWKFHYALDALGHFRYDGETLGLNIAESLMVGNPILTHRSRIWNAHTKYLQPTFARIAEIDDVDMYAQNMKEFINAKKDLQTWKSMREAAYNAGHRLFDLDTYLDNFKTAVAEVFSKYN
jgi:glycosyltransferase involved in cell wall biosynthesis